MTTWSFDLDVPDEGEEVILAVEQGGNQARMFARRHWFDDPTGGTKTLRWQCTVTGRQIDYGRPFAWCEAPIPPGADEEPEIIRDPELPLGPESPEPDHDSPPLDDIDQRLPPHLQGTDF